MSRITKFETGVSFCENCWKELKEDCGTQTFEIRDLYIEPCEVQIVDALCCIYGISWNEFRNSAECDSYPKNPAELNCSLAEKSSVNFCYSCAILLSNNYHVHKEFERSIQPSSIVDQISKFRHREWKSGTHQLFTESNDDDKPPNVLENTTEVFDFFNSENSQEEPYINVSTEIEFKPEFNGEFQISEKEIPQCSVSNNLDCSDDGQLSLRVGKVSVEMEKLTTKNISESNNENNFNSNGQDVDIGEEEPYTETLRCEICGRPCIGSIGLKIHLLAHKEVTKRHNCNICGKTFSRKSNYENHMLNHSESFTLHACGQCGKSFDSQSAVAEHERIHSGPEFENHATGKKHFCNECGNSFSHSDNLARHLKTHKSHMNNTRVTKNNRRRVQCDKCGRDFKNSNSLSAHKSRFHSENILRLTKKIIYKCSFCNKILSDLESLRNHKKHVHQMFQDTIVGI